MKAYTGLRLECGIAQVWVSESGSNASQLLDPAPSLRVMNHSPTGLEWGFGGSGPSQLALAILLDHTGDEATARHFYQDFKSEVVAGLPRHTWTVTSEHVEAWLKTKCEPLAEEDARAFPAGRWNQKERS